MSQFLTRKQRAWFKPDPGQARKHFEKQGLLELYESLKVRQLVPILAKEDGNIIDGERRYRAAEPGGLAELDVIVTDSPMSESEIRICQLTANLHRTDLRDAEKWHAFEEMLRLNPTWSNKELAAHLKLGESVVSKYLSASRCVSEVITAFEAGRIGISTVYELSRVPSEQQAELLAFKLSGASRDAVASRVRKKRSDTEPQGWALFTGRMSPCSKRTQRGRKSSNKRKRER